MEQVLRILLCVCHFFGIYVKPTPDLDDKGVENTKSRNSKNFFAAPFRKRSKGLASHCRRLFRVQRLHIYLILLILCVLYAHGIHCSPRVPTLQLTYIIAVALFTFQLSTNLLIVIEAAFRHAQHTAFLQLLHQIEVCFKLRLRQDVQMSALLKHVYYITASLVAFSLVTLALFMVTSTWVNYIGFFWHGLWCILSLRVRIIQLLVYVRILSHYLQCLCVKLTQIVAYRLAPQRQMLDINYERLTSLEYLLAIGEVHDHIYKAFALLNYFAGWSLFGIVTCYLFDITCNIYWTLLSLDGYPNRQNYYIAGPLTLVPLVVIIVYLCYLCEKCKEADRNLACLLSKIKVLSSMKSMAAYRLVLHRFSAQLQLQRIEVFAQHFFILELRILRSILALSITNLIILTQFLNLELEWIALEQELNKTEERN